MIRTKGTGYKYFERPLVQRMSKQNILLALREAQRANNRYAFKTLFVKTFLAEFSECLENFLRDVEAHAQSKSVQPHISRLNAWKERSKKDVAALSKLASECLLRGYTPEDFRSQCESKVKSRGVDSNIVPPDLFVSIYTELKPLLALKEHPGEVQSDEAV